MQKKLVNLLVLILSFGLLSACDNDDTPSTPATLTEIQITSDVMQIPAGMQTQLTAIGYYSDGLTQDLTYKADWTSLSPELAYVNNGWFSAKKPGDATIKAGFDGVEGSISLTINDAIIVSMIVDPVTESVPQGAEVQYRAIGTFSDQSTHDVSQNTNMTWSSTAAGVAEIETGTAIAKAAGVGSTQMSASLDGVLSNTVSLTVTDAVMTSIWITPEVLTIPLNLVQQFVATATYSDGSELDITNSLNWSSSNFNVVKHIGGAQFQGVREGYAFVSADDVVTQMESANSPSVHVVPSALSDIVVRAGTKGEDRDSIPVGETVQFSATAIFADGRQHDITNFRQVHWQSSDTSIATVSLSGEVHTRKQGTVTIKATTSYLTANSSKTIVVTHP